MIYKILNISQQFISHSNNNRVKNVNSNLVKQINKQNIQINNITNCKNKQYFI